MFSRLPRAAGVMACCAALAACADKSDQIGASYVSPGMYANLSCPQLAEEAQNDLISKLMPLFEKTAEYAAFLVLSKLAEDAAEPEESDETKAAPAAAATQEPVMPIDTKKTNERSFNATGSGFDVETLKLAINEAIEQQQTEKILEFVTTIGKQNPAMMIEVAKTVKVELQDAIMSDRIEEEKALMITNSINELLGDGSKA